MTAGFDAEHLHRRSLRNGENSPMALLPPPTQATRDPAAGLPCPRICRARFLADDAVEIAHHHRVRMRAERRAEDVMGRADVRHPVAHRLVHRFLERALPAVTGTTLAPRNFIRDTLSACRRMSSSPM